VRPLADPRHTLIRDPDQRNRPGNGGTTIASRLQSPERRSPASGSGQLRRDRVPDWCSARLKSPTSPRSCLPRRPAIGLRDFRRSAGADGRPPWYPPNREKRSESARGTSSRIRQSRDARRRRRSVADVDELGVALCHEVGCDAGAYSAVTKVLAARLTREGQQALRRCRSHSPSGHQPDHAYLFPDGRGGALTLESCFVSERKPANAGPSCRRRAASASFGSAGREGLVPGAAR
jgi:hypothetical protein